MIENKDSLAFLKSRNNCEFDVNYSDAPYNLGSKVIVRKDGAMDYARKTDFMDKWEVLGGDYWREWFEESFRTLKHGGHCLMFSIDRQTALFEYYAIRAGFEVKQSLYWYFVSNYPKSTDLSAAIDRHFGEERNEIVGKLNSGNVTGFQLGFRDDKNIYAAKHDLAQKYNGYKYGKAPLKQMCEVVLVFQKPYKTGSCLHDTLRYENGDLECCCSALDIDRNRVGTDRRFNKKTSTTLNAYNERFNSEYEGENIEGRFPTQMFCDSETAKILDMQSGLLKGDKRDFVKVHKREGDFFQGLNGGLLTPTHKDESGCSKSIHICDYEKGEMDLFLYSAKVQKNERNAGVSENNHVTLKPIKLNERILRLFKTPNPQKIVYPFAGVNSEVIGGFRAGFTDFCGCEINPNYCEIGKKRFEYFTLQKSEIETEKEVSENTQISMF